MKVEIKEIDYKETIKSRRFNLLCFLFGHKYCFYGSKQIRCCMRCELKKEIKKWI